MNKRPFYYQEDSAEIWADDLDAGKTLHAGLKKAPAAATAKADAADTSRD